MGVKLPSNSPKSTARIFSDVGGYYVCDSSLPHLDARGKRHSTKADALRAAYQAGYTHAVGSGCYRPGSIAGQVTLTQWDIAEHARI